MRRNSSPFKWRHYAPDVILLCVRWYCRYSLSYRDVEEMMRARSLSVDHVTVFRWERVLRAGDQQKNAPALKDE
jgi:transposase-like protein